jgi:hypothetical protein
MEKKAKAKAEMLKELSREMSDDMYSPMKDMLGKKGMKKVSVMSDSPEGLQKGLTMAEKLMQLKAKQGGEEPTESEEMIPEMEDESDSSEMSPEEMESMYEMLKQKLGK